MRAIQRAIVGVGLVLVAVVAMALLIPRLAGPDPSSQPPAQATGPQVPLADGPAGPPEPVDAAEDTSVGTLPPPDASRATELVSRDLLAPSAPVPAAPDAQAPSDDESLSARKARPAEKPAETSAPAFPQHDFTISQDGWEWGDWDGDERDDNSDCRREDRYDRYDRYDRRYDCDDHDWRD
ncbi:serine/arginine repetitive matrix protein 1 [Nocardioidaceae bacterium Broad-1]|nr:serine/arginine repetitive matrix protein 1 [Nocardioidaceae bacterium Broad-1]